MAGKKSGDILKIRSHFILPIVVFLLFSTGILLGESSTPDLPFDSGSVNRDKSIYSDGPGKSNSLIEATSRLASRSREILPIFFGYSAGQQMIKLGCWRDPAFQKAFEALKPGTIRFPAGTVANYFDWETGWYVPQPKMQKIAREARDPVSSNKLEDFAETIRTSGATPVWDLNLLTSNLEHQLRMLRRIQGLGMSVRYVELGNEFFLDQPDYVARFPTGADYGREATRWIRAIKSEFPGTLIAVVGASPRVTRKRNDPRGYNWNAGLFSTLTGADAVTVHLYNRSGLPPSGIFDSMDVTRMLAEPSKIWLDLRETIRTIPEPMQIWLTEFNLKEINVPVHGTWAHALYVISECMLFLADDRIALIELHAGIGNGVYGALFHDEQGFKFWPGIKSPDQTLPTRKFDRSAVGHAMAVFAEATRGMTSARKLEFSRVPVGGDAMPQLPVQLMGWKFSDGQRHSALLVNPADVAVRLDLKNRGFSSFSMITSDPVRAIDTANSLEISAGILSSGPFLIPGYSITRLEGGQ